MLENYCSIVLFSLINPSQLNDDLKAIAEMTRPNKHQYRTVGQIVKLPSNFHAVWSEALACYANCW